MNFESFDINIIEMEEINNMYNEIIVNSIGACTTYNFWRCDCNTGGYREGWTDYGGCWDVNSCYNFNGEEQRILCGNEDGGLCCIYQKGR